MSDWSNWEAEPPRKTKKEKKRRRVSTGMVADVWGNNPLNGAAGQNAASGNDWGSVSSASNSPADDGWNISVASSAPAPSADGSGGNDWQAPGGTAPAAFNPPPRDHSGAKGPLLALACILAALALVLFFAGRTKTTAGSIDIRQQEKDGVFALQLTYTLEGLEPAKAYAAGFMMAEEGQFPQAVSEPVFITGTDRYTVRADLRVEREGDYQVTLYYYSLTDPTVMTTAPQKLVLRFGVKPRITPLPDAVWFSEVTPTPRPTNTPRPTSTPSPVPTATPVFIPGVLVTPVISSPTPALYPQEPNNSLFDTYDVSTRYFYHQLTPKEKRMFSRMYDGVCAFEERISFEEAYSMREFERSSQALQFDCPELIALGEGYRYWQRGDGSVNAVAWEYLMTRSECESRFNQVMGKIRSMQNQPGFHSGDFGKQTAIYRYLIDNNVYDKDRPMCSSAYSAWMLGYSKCSGYTRALNLALRYWGIPCCEIWGRTYDNGVVDPTSHLWTGIRLNGQWYHCDVTWDDPIGAAASPYAYDVARLPYMNLTDNIMMRARTLYEDVVFDIPACYSTALNYYNTLGATVPAGTAAQTAVHNGLAKAFRNGDDSFALCFESARDYNTAYNSLSKHMFSWNGGKCSYYRVYQYPEVNLMVIVDLQFQ